MEVDVNPKDCLVVLNPNISFRSEHFCFVLDPNSEPKVYIRILSGLTTGAVSVSVAQPTEVVKIRMQAAGAGTGPVYKGVVQAYLEIATKEGLPGLWRG